MQDPVFACARRVVRKHSVMRARDSLKPGLGSRLPNKVLFYYKHYGSNNSEIKTMSCIRVRRGSNQKEEPYLGENVLPIVHTEESAIAC